MTIRTHHLLTAAIVAALALSGCNRKTDDTMTDTPAATTPAPAPAPVTPAEPMPTPGPSTMPAGAAVSVASVTLGNAAGADKRITTPMSTFKPTDPVVVSVATNGAAQNAEVRGRIVYQDGQTAGEETATLNTTGSDTTVMTFNNAKGWPTGTYKAEVWVNGQLAQSSDFAVR